MLRLRGRGPLVHLRLALLVPRSIVSFSAVGLLGLGVLGTVQCQPHTSNFKTSSPELRTSYLCTWGHKGPFLPDVGLDTLVMFHLLIIRYVERLLNSCCAGSRTVVQVAYVCMYVGLYMYMYIYMYMYMYMCMCMYMNMYICIYVYMYICIYVYMYICIYVYMYICMYIYIYIYYTCYLCVYLAQRHGRRCSCSTPRT